VGLEGRTCGLRVWSEGAGQGTVRFLSCAFPSLCIPSFPVVSRSFMGMTRGHHRVWRCHFDPTMRGWSPDSVSFPLDSEPGLLQLRGFTAGSRFTQEESTRGYQPRATAPRPSVTYSNTVKLLSWHDVGVAGHDLLQLAQAVGDRPDQPERPPGLSQPRSHPASGSSARSKMNGNSGSMTNLPQD